MLNEQETQPIKKTRNRAKKPKGQTIKVLTMQQVVTKKYEQTEFTGKWLASFGKPVLMGIWLIWGPSFNGKTSFVMQLIAYLLNWCKIDFYSLEEQASVSIKNAMIREKVMEQPNKVTIIYNATFADIVERNKKKGSAPISVIDSVQYLRLKGGQFEQLKEMFPEKLFIFISHADGADPRGTIAKAMRYDAHAKIFVKGYTASVGMRGMGETQPFIIWPEKAKKFNAKGLLTSTKKEE